MNNIGDMDYEFSGVTKAEREMLCREPIDITSSNSNKGIKVLSALFIILILIVMVFLASIKKIGFRNIEF